VRRLSPRTAVTILISQGLRPAHAGESSRRGALTVGRAHPARCSASRSSRRAGPAPFGGFFRATWTLIAFSIITIDIR